MQNGAIIRSNEIRKPSAFGAETFRQLGDTKSAYIYEGNFMGSVYILTNEAMPDLVKIGYTTRTAKERAEELYKDRNGNAITGVPMRFDVAHEEFCDNPRELETLIHQELAELRPNREREFFTFPELSEAIQRLKEVHKRQPSHVNCVSSESLWRKWTSQFLTRFNKISNRRTPVSKKEEQF